MLCVSVVFAIVTCLTVRLSVRHIGRLYPHGWRYRQIRFQGHNILRSQISRKRCVLSAKLL